MISKVLKTSIYYDEGKTIGGKAWEPQAASSKQAIIIYMHTNLINK